MLSSRKNLCKISSLRISLLVKLPWKLAKYVIKRVWVWLGIKSCGPNSLTSWSAFKFPFIFHWKGFELSHLLIGKSTTTKMLEIHQSTNQKKGVGEFDLSACLFLVSWRNQRTMDKDLIHINFFLCQDFVFFCNKHPCFRSGRAQRISQMI